MTVVAVMISQIVLVNVVVTQKLMNAVFVMEMGRLNLAGMVI